MFGAIVGDDTYYVDDPGDVVGEPNTPPGFPLSGGFDTVYSSVSYALIEDADSSISICACWDGRRWISSGSIRSSCWS